MKSICVIFASLAVGSWAVGLLAENSEPRRPTKIESDVLPNAYRLTDNVFSGGQPEGEAAFKQLKELGVRTVITVDGAKPDVELAKKYGLRYVHLPHGYDGVPESRVTELSKAIRELPGPVYIHCHHGKHRSPAAAASACIAAGLISNAEGLAFLEAAGTGKNYLGLFQSVREAKRVDDKQFDALHVEYPEVAKIPPLADAMIAVEHTHDHLKLVAANHWKPTEKHPDIAPAHEALLLHEHFTELLRTDEVQKEPAAFRELLQQSETQAASFDELLHAADIDTRKVDAAFANVTASCAACHAKFRDVPLKQKAGAAVRP